MASLKPGRSTDPISDSESSDSREEDDEGWADVEVDDEETQQVISLLDDKVFPDVLSMLEYCKNQHGFDFLAVRQRLQLDFHGCVKLVNYIRSRVHEGHTVSENIAKSDIESDQYLKPVLDDDAVIIGLFDLPDVVPEAASSAQGQDASLVDDLVKRNTELQEELLRVTAQFERYRATVSDTLDQRWGDVDAAEAEAAAAKALGKGKEIAGPKKPDDASKYYWESYAGNDIHETMLKDTVRTEAYRDFIYNNKHLFAGKTVLDIGCGTGILSMFCAKAGAARVISVDASDIIDKARENVIHAGLSSTVTLIKGKMEEVTLPVDQVDIIVSEWMGYCLLYEAMLPSVLYARDRYLKPDGLLVPGSCNMWIAPIADGEYVMDNVHFWRDVYGFDMKAMQSGIWDEVRVLHWPKDTVCGQPAGFKLLDLYTIKTEDLTFTAKWKSQLTQDVDAFDGLLIWFDNFFAPSRESQAVNVQSVADEWAKKDKDRIAFTTGPFNSETHWKQGLLLFKYKEGETSALKKDDVIEGDITFAPPEDMPRGLIIKSSWSVESQDKKHTQSWDMR
ncbi:putative Methyltransferase domain-containing protein [Seiridium unicorne]|uniref:type I protein arginine methyltransferase n=1 Tax=Seiridium unicorne TaxID=138068 RepID=A0ABR2VHD3_9PEZI